MSITYHVFTLQVVDNGNGIYRCEKCNKETTEFKWRALANVNFADGTDHIYATCFQEAAELILGNPTETLGTIFSDDQEQFEAICKDTHYKSFIGKFKCKMETYNVRILTIISNSCHKKTV